MHRADADDFAVPLEIREVPHHAPPAGFQHEPTDASRSLHVARGATAPCPLCGSPGEATNLFKGVYMCMADPCNVWTFEAPHEVGRPPDDS